MGLGIVVAVAAKDSDAKVEAMFPCGLEKAVEGLEG